MDDRLEKALDFSQYRQTIEQNRKALKLRVDTLKTLPFNGGTFKVSMDLISFVSTAIETQKLSDIIIEDERGNPVEIDDIPEFLTTLWSTYHSAMNEYMIGTKKLNKARNIKSIMDW